MLACADAIICTLYAVGETAIYDNVQPQAILVDEAARATEPELWPALAFFNPNAFILIDLTLLPAPLQWTPCRHAHRAALNAREHSEHGQFGLL